MINKLKRKFTILATVSMFVLMTVLILIMNIVNFTSIVSESDTIINFLYQPNTPFFNGMIPPEKPNDFRDYFVSHGMSPEIPYESRYFSVIVTPDGEIKESDLSKIISVDDDSVKQYITKAIKTNKERGFIGKFRYLKQNNDDVFTKIIFLDCGRKIDAFYMFFGTSVFVGLLGCIIVFISFLFIAGKIVKPIAESYEKQKRFISDAGHEIKTPLTIINANIDLLECDVEKEELEEIRSQTKRLTELTNNLVLLSKMEESEHKIQKIEIPLSDIISETANSFHILADYNNIKFVEQIAPNITLNASPNAISQLISILLENAIKYSSNGGMVTINVSSNKKISTISIFNTTKEKIKQEDLQYVFDRFYRTDTSRNSATGGYGIGLSIAKAIVDSHNGNIVATTKSGYDFCVTVELPL